MATKPNNQPAKKVAIPVKAPKAQGANQKSAETPAKPRRADWEAIERDYRVGKLTLREIAHKHGVTAGRICQKAKESAWSRGDLKATVNAATQALLVAEQVEGEVNRVKQGLNDAVLGAAELNKQVILKHRDRIRRTTDVAMRMLEELDQTTVNQEGLAALFEKAGTDMTDLELATFRGEVRAFLKLHNRIASLQRLTAALRDAQNLEAQAYGNIYDGKDAGAGDETQNLTDEELDGAINQLLNKLQR